MKRSAHLVPVITGLSLVALAITAVGCGSASSPVAPSATGAVTFIATPGAQVLVDASRDGGLWWFPQSGTFNPDSGHQGKALADAIRRRGFVVDELGRGVALTPALLGNYRLVIRAGSCVTVTPYTPSELAAYDELLTRDVAIILLTDHMNGGCNTTDPLAQRFGSVIFSGSETGTVTSFSAHEITTGVNSLTYVAGSTVTSFDASKVQILATIGAATKGSPRKPVMGIINGYTARIFFLGDVTGIQGVSNPFVDNLINWALP